MSELIIPAIGAAMVLVVVWALLAPKMRAHRSDASSGGDGLSADCRGYGDGCDSDGGGGAD